MQGVSGDTEQGQGIKTRGFQVIGIVAVDFFHRVGVGLIAGWFVPLAVEELDGIEVSLLPRSQSGDARYFRKRLSGQLFVLLFPEGVVVGHSLAPIAHDKIGIRFSGLAKRFQGFLIPERVQGGDTMKKMPLGFPGPGGRKFYFS